MSHLRVIDTPQFGRTTVATTNLRPGDVIEVCPFVTFDRSVRSGLVHTPVWEYFVVDGGTGTSFDCGIAFGAMSFTAHSDTPNAELLVEGGFASLVALREIDEGEFVEIYYPDIASYRERGLIP